jgi:hypothetical protein
VGQALSLACTATMTEASMLPGTLGCLGLGLERGQRQGRRGRRRVQTHSSHRKETAATKDDNLRPHGQSLPPSPPGPNGKLAPCNTGHFCNSALPGCVSIRTRLQQLVVACRPHVPHTTWGWANKTHPSISQQYALGKTLMHKGQGGMA